MRLTQFAFLYEAERLKTILRGTTLLDALLRKNSEEHSWYIWFYAVRFREHAERPVDIDRVLRMLLLHDVVIDAGDAPIHGAHDTVAQAAAERAAADRLFGLLPPDEAAKFRSLWDEFQAAETNDAVYAKSVVDWVQPVVSNLRSGGTTSVS